MQYLADVVDGRVRERIEIEDGLIPGIDIFAPTFAAGLVPCAADTAEGDLYDAGTFTRPPPLPALVPASVTRAQAKIALLRVGLLSRVEAEIRAAGGEIALWFADAATWRRDSPYVDQMATALDLGASEVDALFVAASIIEA